MCSVVVGLILLGLLFRLSIESFKVVILGFFVICGFMVHPALGIFLLIAFIASYFRK